MPENAPSPSSAAGGPRGLAPIKASWFIEHRLLFFTCEQPLESEWLVFIGNTSRPDSCTVHVIPKGAVEAILPAPEAAEFGVRFFRPEGGAFDLTFRDESLLTLSVAEDGVICGAKRACTMRVTVCAWTKNHVAKWCRAVPVAGSSVNLVTAIDGCPALGHFFREYLCVPFDGNIIGRCQRIVDVSLRPTAVATFGRQLAPNADYDDENIKTDPRLTISLLIRGCGPHAAPVVLARSRPRHETIEFYVKASVGPSWEYVFADSEPYDEYAFLCDGKTKVLVACEVGKATPLPPRSTVRFLGNRIIIQMYNEDWDGTLKVPTRWLERQRDADQIKRWRDVLDVPATFSLSDAQQKQLKNRCVSPDDLGENAKALLTCCPGLLPFLEARNLVGRLRDEPLMGIVRQLPIVLAPWFLDFVFFLETLDADTRQTIEFPSTHEDRWAYFKKRPYLAATLRAYPFLTAVLQRRKPQAEVAWSPWPILWDQAKGIQNVNFVGFWQYFQRLGRQEVEYWFAALSSATDREETFRSLVKLRFEYGIMNPSVSGKVIEDAIRLLEDSALNGIQERFVESSKLHADALAYTKLRRAVLAKEPGSDSSRVLEARDSLMSLLHAAAHEMREIIAVRLDRPEFAALAGIAEKLKSGGLDGLRELAAAEKRVSLPERDRQRPYHDGPLDAPAQDELWRQITLGREPQLSLDNRVLCLLEDECLARIPAIWRAVHWMESLAVWLRSSLKLSGNGTQSGSLPLWPRTAQPMTGNQLEAKAQEVLAQVEALAGDFATSMSALATALVSDAHSFGAKDGLNNALRGFDDCVQACGAAIPPVELAGCTQLRRASECARSQEFKNLVAFVILSPIYRRWLEGRIDDLEKQCDAIPSADARKKLLLMLESLKDAVSPETLEKVKYFHASLAEIQDGEKAWKATHLDLSRLVKALRDLEVRYPAMEGTLQTCQDLHILPSPPGFWMDRLADQTDATGNSLEAEIEGLLAFVSRQRTVHRNVARTIAEHGSCPEIVQQVQAEPIRPGPSKLPPVVSSWLRPKSFERFYSLCDKLRMFHDGLDDHLRRVDNLKRASGDTIAARRALFSAFSTEVGETYEATLNDMVARQDWEAFEKAVKETVRLHQVVRFRDEVFETTHQLPLSHLVWLLQDDTRERVEDAERKSRDVRAVLRDARAMEDAIGALEAAREYVNRVGGAAAFRDVLEGDLTIRFGNLERKLKKTKIVSADLGYSAPAIVAWLGGAWRALGLNTFGKAGPPIPYALLEFQPAQQAILQEGMKESRLWPTT